MCDISSGETVPLTVIVVCANKSASLGAKASDNKTLCVGRLVIDRYMGHPAIQYMYSTHHTRLCKHKHLHS
jgi:hypothetical protein